MRQASAIIKLELGEDRSFGCPVDFGNPSCYYVVQRKLYQRHKND